MKTATRVAFATWLLTTSGLSGAAEQMSAIKQRGVNTNSALSPGDLDAVNGFNGNLSVSIPLGTAYAFPSGLGYQFVLSYNSTLWDSVDYSGIAFPNQNDPLPVSLTVPMGDSNAGFGWRVSLGDLYPPKSQTSLEDLSENGIPVNETATWAYSGPDGGRHYFNSVPNPDSLAGLSAGVLYSSDGSRLRLRTISDTRRELDFPDGSVHTFDCLPYPGNASPDPLRADCWQLTRIEDAYARVGAGLGNWVSIQHPTTHDGDMVVLDSLGRSHTISYRALATGNRYFNRVVERVDLAAAGTLDDPDLDRRVHYDLLVDEKPIVRGCTYGSYRAYKIGNRLIPQVLTVPMLSGLEVHDPQAVEGKDLLGSYSFNYHRIEDPAQAAYDCAFINGRLETMTQPTGKRTQWVYGSVPMPAPGCDTPLDENGLPGPTPQQPRVEGVVEKHTHSNPEGTSDPARWLYVRAMSEERQTNVPTTCEVIPRQLSTAIQDPRGHISVQYYSVYQHADYWGEGSEGWTMEEYGQPYSRYRSRNGISVDLPGAQPLTLFIGGEFYECPADYDPRTPGDAPADWNATHHIPAAVNGCTLLRQTYVAYDGDYVADPHYGPAPIGSPQCETVAPAPNYPSGPAPIECGQTNRRVRESMTVYADDGFRYRSTRNDDFDHLGHYRRTTSDGNFSTGPDRGGPIRSYTNYNAGFVAHQVPGADDPWILGLYSKSLRWQGTDVDRTDHVFDTQTGFLKRMREVKSLTATLKCDSTQPQRLTDPTPGAGDVGVEYVPVKVGDAIKNGEIASVRISGGDVSALPTGGCAVADFANATPQFIQTLAYQHGQVARAATVSNVDQSTELLVNSRATVDRNSGLALQVWDASGVSTVATFDVTGRTLRQQTGSLPATTYLYCTATSTTEGCQGANRLKVATVRNNGTTITDGTLHFDGHGRVVLEEKTALVDGAPAQPADATKLVKRKTSYDPGGLVLQRTPFETAPTIPSNNYLYSHDAFGRLLDTTMPDLNLVRNSYQGDRVVTRKSRVARPDDQHPMIPVELHYDEHGRLVAVHEDSRGVYSQDVPETVTYYKHDVNGNVRFVNMVGSDGTGADASQERLYEFDGLGRIRSEVLPELGLTPTGTPASIKSHEHYDALGNLLRTRTGTQLLVSQYDAIGRLLRSYEGEPVANRLLLERSYGVANITGDMRLGRVVSEKRHNYIPVDPDAPLGEEEHWVVREDYRYGGPSGSLDRTSLRTTRYVGGVQTGGGVGFDTSASFLATGEIDKLNYPDCDSMGCSVAAAPDRAIAYRYAHGMPTDVSLVNGETSTRVASYQYQPNGMLKALRHYNAAGTVTATEGWTPDDSGMPRVAGITLTTLRANQVPSAVVSWTSGPIQYDGSGNIRSAGTDSYTYDRARRLKSSTTGGKSQDIRYDAFGNIVSFAFTGLEQGQLTRTFAVDPHTNRLSGTNYGYDDRGNMTTWHGRKLGYDAFDMPSHASWQAGGESVRQAYIYAPGDRRVAIIDYDEGGEQFWTVRRTSGSVLREFTRVPGNEPTWHRDYITSATRTLSSIEATANGEQQRRYHVDHLGSTRAVTAIDGAVVARYDYFPFGELALSTGQEADDKRVLFTGHERDRNGEGSEDDLDYMMARYYAPAYGRFLSLDALPGSAESPQSWNRYSYVLNNPLMHVDPTGNQCASPGPGMSDIADPSKCAAIQSRSTFHAAEIKGSRAEVEKYFAGSPQKTFDDNMAKDGAEVRANKDKPHRGGAHRGQTINPQTIVIESGIKPPEGMDPKEAGNWAEKRIADDLKSKYGKGNTYTEVAMRAPGEKKHGRLVDVLIKVDNVVDDVKAAVPKGTISKLTDIAGKGLKKLAPGPGLVEAGIALREGRTDDAIFAAGGELPGPAGWAMDAAGLANQGIKSDAFVSWLADRL